MKKINMLTGLLFASVISSQAAVVYTNTFDNAFDFTDAGAIELGGATPDVVAEDFFGGTNGVVISGSQLQFSLAPNPIVAGENRSRSAGVWLNPTGWAIGTITVEFDISNYVAGGTAAAETYYQAYFASGVDASNAVGLDIQGGAAADPVLSGSATSGTLGAENAFTADGSLSFTFNYTGAEEFIGLVFSSKSGIGTGNFQAQYNVDNLVVSDTTVIPEPSSTALLGLGGLAFLLRRRR